MNETHNLKVGDELAFKSLRGRWYLLKIEAITPTGRIKCGTRTLNPDLSIRGRIGYSTPYRGEIPTPEIIAEIERENLLALISRTEAKYLTTDQLERICAIIKEPQ